MSFRNNIPIFRKSSRSLSNFDGLLEPFSFLKDNYNLPLNSLETTPLCNQFFTNRINDKKEVLVRQVIITENPIFRELKKILETFQSLEDPHIDRYLEIHFVEKGKNDEIVFVSEKQDLNLYDMITTLEEYQPRSEEELLQIFSDIASGLYFCHGKDLTHQNIEPFNIVLIHGVERPQKAQKVHVYLPKNLYKLRDWKFDQVILIENIVRNSKKMINTKKNNILRPFCAPEAYNNNKLFNDDESKAMDVYSLGMCMLSFCGVPLKRIQSVPLSIQEIHNYQLEKIFQEFVTKAYNWLILEILKGMLKYDVKERWNIEQVWISLKALRTIGNGKNLESEESKSTGDINKSGILQRFLQKFGGSSSERKEKDSSLNSDNESVNNKFTYKLTTKNISINLVSREDYKSFMNVKPMKNYKKLSYEIEDIIGSWKQIKPNSVENFTIELRTERELSVEFLEFCIQLIKEKAKMSLITKFLFRSTFEQVSGDFSKFTDTNYFVYSLHQNKVYIDNNLCITHIYTKNNHEGMLPAEVLQILKMLYFFNKLSLKSLNFIIKSFSNLTDDSLSDLSQILFLYGQSLEEINIFFSGESITDKAITQILGGLIDGVSKSNEMQLRQFSFGFGAGNKVTDESLFAVAKALITLSSKTAIHRLSLYLNSLEITNEGLESIGAALPLLSKSLTSLTLVVATLYNFHNYKIGNLNVGTRLKIKAFIYF